MLRAAFSATVVAAALASAGCGEDPKMAPKPPDIGYVAPELPPADGKIVTPKK